MGDLKLIQSAIDLDNWRKERDLSLGQLQELVWRLRSREEFQKGYARAERDQKLALAAEAARERNGGEEPDYHNCHFCGTFVFKGYEVDGTKHYLSDCRPDLVKHEPGPVCTWHNSTNLSNTPGGKADCYAYQNRDINEWGDKHEHFYDDGPM